MKATDLAGSSMEMLENFEVSIECNIHIKSEQVDPCNSCSNSPCHSCVIEHNGSTFHSPPPTASFSKALKEEDVKVDIKNEVKKEEQTIQTCKNSRLYCSHCDRDFYCEDQFVDHFLVNCPKYVLDQHINTKLLGGSDIPLAVKEKVAVTSPGKNKYKNVYKFKGRLQAPQVAVEDFNRLSRNLLPSAHTPIPSTKEVHSVIEKDFSKHILNVVTPDMTPEIKDCLATRFPKQENTAKLRSEIGTVERSEPRKKSRNIISCQKNTAHTLKRNKKPSNQLEISSNSTHTSEKTVKSFNQLGISSNIHDNTQTSDINEKPSYQSDTSSPNASGDKLNSKAFKFCQQCGSHFRTETLLQEHLAKNHSVVNQISYKCPYCPKICYNRREISEHVTECSSKFECNFCSYKSAFKEQIKVHERNHSILDNAYILKPYQCKECSYRTTERGLLFKHTVKTHFPNRPKHLKCKHCPYAIDRLDSLRRHLKRCHDDCS